MARHKIPHGLSLDLAQRATRAALESYREQFPEVQPTGRWTSDSHAEVSFTVAGKTLRGEVDVDPQNILLDLDVPLVFRPFRSTALRIIDEEIRAWIAKARDGRLPSDT
jgi:hypothetical protein